MKSIIFLICATLQICSGHNVWTQTRDTCESATAGAFICSDDCNKIQYCPGDGSTIEVQDCAAKDLVCSGGDKPTCVAADKSNCSVTNPNATFVCMAFGQVINPVDCSYFICAELNKPPVAQCSCDEGSLFDPGTLVCSAALTECPPPPKCTEAHSCGLIGEEGATHFYYVCRPDKSYFVVKCAGQASPPAEGICQCAASPEINEEDEPTIDFYDSCAAYTVATTESESTADDTTEPDTTADDTTEPDTTADDTTEPDTTVDDTTVDDTTEPDTTVDDTTVGTPTDTPPTCTVPGQIFAVTSDCHYYYMCTALLQPVLMRCSDGFYFSGGRCIVGDC